jgi:hypothetical protein
MLTCRAKASRSCAFPSLDSSSCGGVEGRTGILSRGMSSNTDTLGTTNGWSCVSRCLRSQPFSQRYIRCVPYLPFLFRAFVCFSEASSDFVLSVDLKKNVVLFISVLRTMCREVVTCHQFNASSSSSPRLQRARLKKNKGKATNASLTSLILCRPVST